MTAKRSLKKVMCAALAGASVFASAAMFSSCTTSHPKVEMKIDFGKTTYTLEYKLYRKLAPSTVQHFLELVENKYYDGLCVHDYTSGRLYTGGYSFEAGASNGGLVEKDYFGTVKAYKNFTHSVWDDAEGTDPMYTVYGEFSDNGFSVESGALRQDYGALTMYYTPKTSCDADVYVKRADGKGNNLKPYKNNSATSLFYISLSSASASSQYCTFATLEEDSIETLENLVKAIEEYIEDNYDGEKSDFAPSSTVTVDEDDRYASSFKYSATYSVPLEPIVIRSVTVKSY